MIKTKFKNEGDIYIIEDFRNSGDDRYSDICFVYLRNIRTGEVINWAPGSEMENRFSFDKYLIREQRLKEIFK